MSHLGREVDNRTGDPRGNHFLDRHLAIEKDRSNVQRKEVIVILGGNFPERPGPIAAGAID
jgi:hypothetical protein